MVLPKIVIPLEDAESNVLIFVDNASYVLLQTRSKSYLQSAFDCFASDCGKAGTKQCAKNTEVPYFTIQKHLIK